MTAQIVYNTVQVGPVATYVPSNVNHLPDTAATWTSTMIAPWKTCQMLVLGGVILVSIMLVISLMWQCVTTKKGK